MTRLEQYRESGRKLYELSGGLVGYLIPAMENGRYIERTLLIYGGTAVKKRPFAWAAFDMETEMLLYYRHCFYEDFMDTKQYPPQKDLGTNYSSKRTVREQRAYEKQLWDAYEKIRDYVFQKNLSIEQQNKIKVFSEQWEKTVLVDLQPYYRNLSPEFFSWIESFK